MTPTFTLNTTATNTTTTWPLAHNQATAQAISNPPRRTTAGKKQNGCDIPLSVFSPCIGIPPPRNNGHSNGTTLQAKIIENIAKRLSQQLLANYRSVRKYEGRFDFHVFFLTILSISTQSCMILYCSIYSSSTAVSSRVLSACRHRPV